MAWRTHDAQYWGVPQRRRRISVVADFGGDTASEIQFDGESVSGDITASGAAGEGLAEAAERGFNPAGGDCMTAWDCQSKRIFDTNGKSPTLQGGVGGGVNNPAIFAAIPNNEKATRWQGGGESRNHDGSGNGLGIGKEGDPSPTLTAGDRHGVMCAGFKLGNSEQARSIGYQEELSPTLNAECGGNKPAVVALDMTHACDVIRECGEKVPALQARMGTGGNQVPLTYQMNGFGDYRDANVASSCKQRDFKDSTDLAITNMVVRRLTPLECTRLQGYPDGWVDIGDWTDEKGKKHKDADSPKYKALGNSIALPFWDWMLRRMARYLPEGATLGSLFDGIAGFPLIWERIHGKGTARWASEIEPFPIAVTKKWFMEE